MTRVLLVGAIDDPHVQCVSSELFRTGATCSVFDQLNPSHSIAITAAAGKTEVTFSFGEERVAAEEFTSAWWRVKTQSNAAPSSLDEYIADEFARREWQHTLRSLPYVAPALRWVNHPTQYPSVAFKPSQLALAQDVGFSVPTTAFTNSEKVALEVPEPLIYKTIGPFIGKDREFIYTNLVDHATIRSAYSQIRRAPCTFQSYVEKAFELRVTVVGQRVWAAKVNSQEIPEARTDWRRAQFDEMFEEYQADTPETDRVLDFQRRAGLDFAAYDFIVDESGRWIFLECNPAGQWLWLEHKLQFPIAREIASVLSASR